MSRLRITAAIAVALLALAGIAGAQTDVTTTRISGVVRGTDESPLPGAKIEVTNQETGLVVTATADAAGATARSTCRPAATPWRRRSTASRPRRRPTSAWSGINHAPALIRADVGIAIGSGTDASMESADIILLSNELDKIRLAMRLSRRILKTIRQNIIISIIYNIIMVPLAMMALVTPLVAAISMPVSSIAVIANAARIRTFTKDR